MGGVIKSYFSEETSSRERAGVMAQLGVAGTLGFLIGPALGAAFGFLPDIHISQSWGIDITFSKLTAPGLFSSLCFLSSLIVFLFLFQEPDHYGPQEETGSLSLLHEEETSYSESHSNQKPDRPLMAAMNVMDALLYTGLVVYQTVAMPLTQTHYQWDVKENGLLWLGTAIFSSLSYTSIPYATKKLHEATILLISTFLLTIAFSIMIDWPGSLPLWRFLLGTALVSLFFPLATTPLDTLYSKTLVGSPSFYFALFAFAAALARISAPVWAGAMNEHLPEMWVFVTTAAAQFTAAVLAMCIYQRVQKRVAQKEQEITDEFEDSTVFI